MKTLTTLLLLITAFAATAGDLSWETDFEKAKQVAASENKTILINFTGSDWCGWCKRLDREVFSKDEFSAFAGSKLVLVKIDFPKYEALPEAQQAANQKLAEKYGIQGFPSILLVDASGKVKMTTGYQPGGADAYVKHLQTGM